MLIAQMAACVVLLVSTTLLIRTFVRLQNETCRDSILTISRSPW